MKDIRTANDIAVVGALFWLPQCVGGGDAYAQRELPQQVLRWQGLVSNGTICWIKGGDTHVLHDNFNLSPYQGT